MKPFPMIDEKSLTLVAAVFPDGQTATSAAQRLQSSPPPLAKWQVSVVEPRDRFVARKLEPEISGIWHTALRTHGVLGVGGFLLGLVLGWIAVDNNWWGAASTPVLSVIVIASFIMIAGLLCAGFVTLRPDHTLVIDKVRQASKSGKWAVVAHPTNAEETERTTETLERAGGELVRSL
jgi:hypothetical protein